MPVYDVNFDSPVATSSDWSIWPDNQLKSRVRGPWNFSQSKLGLYLTPSQKILKQDKTLSGRKVIQELRGQPVVGVQLIDFLIGRFKEGMQFPEDWDRKTIFFFGTIYQSFREETDDGQLELYVEYLYLDTGSREYVRGYKYLGEPSWGTHSPALITVDPKLTKTPEAEEKKPDLGPAADADQDLNHIMSSF